LGTGLVTRAGGTSSPVGAVLNAFQRAVKTDHAPEDRVLVIDETGLPTRPGENQTSSSICLSYMYAFGKGERAVGMGKEWFRENFGITFTEEEREVKILTLRRIAANQSDHRMFYRNPNHSRGGCATGK
jgi:hypothetical protein